MRSAALLVLLLLAVPALASAPSHNLDWPAIADRIVRQLALQPGERVLLLGYPDEFEDLVAPLRQAVARAGGVDVGSWTVLPRTAPGLPTDTAAQKSAEAARAAVREMVEKVDAAVMLPGATPADSEYAALQDLLRSGHGRTVHFHWNSRWTPSAMPVPGVPLPSEEVIDATYQRALLAADCKAIGETQRRFAAAMREGEVRVTSPQGTNLRFRIGDRPVNFQDGDASAARARAAKVLVDREIELPCGALRVAPLEETVEGTIAFPPAEWGGKQVSGLKLRFDHGKVVEVTAATGKEAVEQELDKGGPAARSFREFALGFNPELAVIATVRQVIQPEMKFLGMVVVPRREIEVPTIASWIPYYGYGAGVVRLSLGDNGELGGTVRGDYVRWNFFADTTVTVGGKVWVKDGRMEATAPPRPAHR
jgi:aminopeptidase